jgi:hypothetical protein
VMVRDGAVVAGCLADAESVCETFRHGVDGILWARSVR